ncbi:hypothetical protein NLX83_38995 [Allokutzneria sp. A3M-2-11 16]|uniref:hypothetical protein n=1 Tax=Allokutzneria sp. A3M-2-11 16 TaxID=2962043 RepID=UPI0020B7B77D|nr:hypothetical protein [Allokutzneria sp. A3M-2-11 16]MCP3805270.1 hypothetical protein [Allokutzneria sp. A3M-2-11 16]
MRERLGFDIEVSHNEHLPPGTRELDAVLSVRATPLPAAPSEPPPAAEVIIFDGSAHLKQAVMAAVDALPDGVAFAVLAGSRMAFPVGRQLCPATPENRAVAKAAVSIVTPGSGSATMRDWLALADRLFVEHEGAVRHALLVTARDSGEDERELARAAEACAGHFVCDCVAVGENSDVGGLRTIAGRLGGSVELVADPARLPTNLVSAVAGMMTKSVSDTALRLWLPKGARVRLLEQVHPVHVDLTQRRGRLGYRTDAWGAERREYHLRVELEPSGSGQSVIATRARLVRPATAGEPGEFVPLAAGLVTASWSEEIGRTLPLDPMVAAVLGKSDLARAVRAALTARAEGNMVSANEQFSEAVRHAAEAGDTEMLNQLDRVVESDPVTGAVRLKEQPAANGMSVVPKAPKPARRRRAVVQAIESTLSTPSPRPRGRHRRAEDEILDVPWDSAFPEPLAPTEPPADVPVETATGRAARAAAEPPLPRVETPPPSDSLSSGEFLPPGESLPRVEALPAVEPSLSTETPPSVDSLPRVEALPLVEPLPPVEPQPPVEPRSAVEPQPSGEALPSITALPPGESLPRIEAPPSVEPLPSVETLPSVERLPSAETPSPAEPLPRVEAPPRVEERSPVEQPPPVKARSRVARPSRPATPPPSETPLPRVEAPPSFEPTPSAEVSRGDALRDTEARPAASHAENTEEPEPSTVDASTGSWGGWPSMATSPNGTTPQQPSTAETTVLKRARRKHALPTGETPRIKKLLSQVSAPEPQKTTVLKREPAATVALSRSENPPPAEAAPTTVVAQPTMIAKAPATANGAANGASPAIAAPTVVAPAPWATASSPVMSSPVMSSPAIPVPAMHPAHPAQASRPAIPRPASPQLSAPHPIPTSGGRTSGPWPAQVTTVRTGLALPADPRKDLDAGLGVPAAQNFWFWVEIQAPPPVTGAEDAVLSVALFEFPGEFAIKQDAALGQIRLGADGSSTVLRQPSIVQDGTRLCFPVTSPYTLGPARVRCNVYWRQTLVQSILVHVQITAKPVPCPNAMTSTVDYRVADPAETLSMPQVPEHSGSLLLTGDGRGSQSVRLVASDGRETLRAETSLGEHQLAEEIRLARGALNRVAWASAEPWRAGLEYRYAKPPTVEQFTLDLGLLATHGRRLYQLLMSGVPEHVGAAFAKPGFVQIPLAPSSRHVLPTALIYDLPLDIGSPVLRLCADFLAAVQRGGLYGSPCFLRTCAHARQPDPTTVCPGGFWGFRHALGLPVSVGLGPSLPPTLPSGNGVGLAGGVYRGFASAEEHSAALRRMLPWRGFQLGETHERTLSELDSDPQVVYFYSHGGVDGDTPFLRVGTDSEEPLTPADLRQRRLRWQRSRPLVFLNTSKVTGMRPERAMGLVGYFVNEALASGVIGTETTVFEELADEFGQEVLRSFVINRDAIGVAVMRARIALLAKGNPLGLAYVPFVSPSIGLAAG